MRLRNIFASLLLAIGFMGFSQAASACSAPDPDPAKPPIIVICTEESGGWYYAQVIIPNYTTFAETAGFCSCAFNLPQQIGEVVAAQIIESKSRKELASFRFEASDGASKFPGPDTWQGFSSAVFSEVKEGLEVSLVFTVRSKDPFCEELAKWIQSAEVIAVTDKGNEDGTPTDKHMKFREGGEVDLRRMEGELPDRLMEIIKQNRG